MKKRKSHNLDTVQTLFSIAALVVMAMAAYTPTLAADELPPHMVEMETALSHQKVLIGESQEIYATIDLEAQNAEVEERPPMNLAVVIDKSGSMRGERIRQARRAALHVVDSLTEQDRLALITYGSGHTVEFDSTAIDDRTQDKMRETIRSIRARGGTNLSAGYKAGAREVQKHHHEDAINRVLLLSDGKANRGITDPDRLRSLSRQAFDDGISTSTIGFGLDYNEQVMTGMAVEGSGNYYFADDSDDLQALIGGEMTGLSATVANRVEVLLDPGPGVEVAQVLGFSHRFRDGKAVVPLSELGAGQSRSIVVRLQVAPQQPEVMDVMTVRANYRDAINDRHRFRRQHLRAGITEVASEVDAHVDREVLTRVEEVLLAQAMDEAMDAYASGDSDGARAVLERESNRSRQVQQDHDIDSDRLQDMEESFDRAGSTMGAQPASSSEGRRMRMESSEETFEIKISK